MFNSPIFETIIGLVMLILLFSVLVTCVQEGYATIFKLRGKMLQQAIAEMLKDTNNTQNFAETLYKHPQISRLCEKSGDMPSYIDKTTFSRALVDVIAQQSMEPATGNDAGQTKTAVPEQLTERSKQILNALPANSAMANAGPAPNTSNEPVNTASLNLMQRFELGIGNLNDSDLKTMLKSFHLDALSTPINNLVNDAEALKQRVENWYEGYMTRVTAWYRKKVRKNIFFASAVVTLVFNLNLISLSKITYADSKLRGALVALAEKTASDSNAINNLRTQLLKDSGSSLSSADVNAVIGVQLPIGWKVTPDSASNHNSNWFTRSWGRSGLFEQISVERLAGWILMIMVLSLGAPFWFDILKRIVNLRSAGNALLSGSKT